MVVVDMDIEYCFPGVHDIVEDSYSDIATSTYIETVGMDDQHYGINNENATVPGLPQYEYDERDYIPRITPPSGMMIQTLNPIPILRL